MQQVIRRCDSKGERAINPKYEAALLSDLLFIDCNSVSTKWQWSVKLYKCGKGQLYTQGETIHKTIPKHRIFKIENNIENKEINLKGY